MDAKKYDYYRLKDLTSDYVDVFYAKRPVICKTIWIVWFLGMAVFGIYLSLHLLLVYIQHTTSTEVYTTYVGTVGLPTVTICALSVLNFTAFEVDHGKEAALYNKMMHTVSKTTNSNGSAYTALDTKLQRSVYGDYKYNPANFLFGSEYIFAGQNKTITDKDVVPTQLGYCFQMNEYGEDVQQFPGPKGGYSLVLDAQTSTYIPAISSSGFRVILHNMGEGSVLDTIGFNIPVGKDVDVALTKTHVTKLEPPYGTCSNETSRFNIFNNHTYEEHILSIEECNLNATIIAYIEKCKCIPWFFYDRYNVSHRSFVEEYEYKYSITNVTECKITSYEFCTNLLLTELDDNFKNCKEPCGYYQYEVRTSMATYPATQNYTSEYLKGYYTTLADARDNMVSLKIYYEDMVVSTEEQSKAYDFANFMAELGGMLDLFIGFSFFTVIQLGEIIFMKLVPKKKSAANNDSPPGINVVAAEINSVISDAMKSDDTKSSESSNIISSIRRAW